jgi:hypothetical protein
LRRYLDHSPKHLLSNHAFMLEAGHLILDVAPGQLHGLHLDVLIGGPWEAGEADLRDGGLGGDLATRHRWLAVGDTWVLILATPDGIFL